MVTAVEKAEASQAGLSPRQFWLAMVLASLSGAAALGHEVLLSRRLIDVLGASNASISRVFGCFFLGLSLGALGSSWYLQRLRNPWRAAAWAELGVALLMLPALSVAWWSDWIWPTLGLPGLTSWMGNAIKLGLSLALVFPPAFCMGLFLPSLSRAVLNHQYSLQRHGIWLYAANTLGGMLGIVGVSLYLLHSLGAWLSMLVGCLVNACVAVVCGAQVWRGEREPEFDAKDIRGQSSDYPQFVDRRQASEATNFSTVGNQKAWWPLFLLAGLSGFGILAFEMLAIQLVSLSAPLSFYAAPTVLAVVVLSLAASAAIVPWLLKTQWRLEAMLCSSVTLTAFVLLLTAVWFRWLLGSFTLEGTVSLSHFWWLLSLFCFLAMTPTLLVAGLIFPLLTAWLGERGDPQGMRWGTLLACNGLGGLLGAELALGWLLPKLGLFGGLAGLGLGYALLGLVLIHTLRARLGTATARLAITCVALLLTAGGSWWLSSWRHTRAADVAILDERAGREGIVSVIHSDVLGLRIAVSGQYILGGTKFRFDQQRMAHVPLVLHANPQSVGVIGLATGISAGAVLEHRQVESLQVAELAPLVVRAADQFFRPYNHQVTEDERAKVVVEDGRTFIAASPRTFDVVIGDLFLPWAPGEARLYSVEHFTSVRASLKPGGIYCQWLAAYQLTNEHLALIEQTFSQVFSTYHLFRLTFDDLTPGVALVGFASDDLSWEIVAERCEQLRRSGQVLDPWVRHPDGIGMLYLGKGLAIASDPLPTNTLTNMRFELESGRERISQREAGGYLAGDRWLQYIQEQRLPVLAGTPDLQRLAVVGHQLTLVETGIREMDTLSPAEQAYLRQLLQAVVNALPPAIRNDRGADWNQWHGSQRTKRELIGNAAD